MKVAEVKEVKVPEKFKKIYEIVEVENEDDDGSYMPGDKIDGMTVLALLEAKEGFDEYESALLLDSEDFPVVQVAGDRVYPVEVRD